MESHHLVKSPILLGARKRLRRYLSTDSRRGGARLLEEEETCAICSPILFVHSRIIRLFFCKNLSCESLLYFALQENIVSICIFYLQFVICFLLFVYLLSFFIYVLACNIYYLAQLVPIFLAHAGGPSVSAIIIDTTATVVMLRAISM